MRQINVAKPWHNAIDIRLVFVAVLSVSLFYMKWAFLILIFMLELYWKLEICIGNTTL